jgi:hypothetical protein
MPRDSLRSASSFPSTVCFIWKSAIAGGVNSLTDKQIVESLSAAESSTDKEITQSFSVAAAVSLRFCSITRHTRTSPLDSLPPPMRVCVAAAGAAAAIGRAAIVLMNARRVGDVFVGGVLCTRVALAMGFDSFVVGVRAGAED